MKAPWFFQGHVFASSKLHTFVPNLFKAPQKMTLQALSSTETVNIHTISTFESEAPRKLTISCQKYRDLSYLYVFPVILCMKCCTITVSFVRLDLKLHAFWYLSKIVRTHRKLTTLEWKLHGFFRVISFEFKAPHFCPKFVQSSTAK